MPWRQTGYLRLAPSLTWQCSPQVERVLDEAPAGGRIVDLGAGGRTLRADCLRVDVHPQPDVDLVADAHHLPFADGTFALALGTGLLEHVADDRRVLREMARVLAPRGRAHVELPFLQQHHRDGIDVRRLSVEGLEREIARAGLTVETAGFHIGPSVTVATLLAHYAALWFEGRGPLSRAMSAGVFLAASFVLYPLKYLDAFLRRKPDAQRLAFGVYCTARKPAGAAGGVAWGSPEGGWRATG